jgi:hypothetical protein
MPVSIEARRDAIERAQRSLDHEARRLQRIGFETPLERCQEERRFWNFLAAVHADGTAPVFEDRPTSIEPVRKVA